MAGWGFRAAVGCFLSLSSYSKALLQWRSQCHIEVLFGENHVVKISTVSVSWYQNSRCLNDRKVLFYIATMLNFCLKIHYINVHPPGINQSNNTILQWSTAANGVPPPPSYKDTAVDHCNIVLLLDLIPGGYTLI